MISFHDQITNHNRCFNEPKQGISDILLEKLERMVKNMEENTIIVKNMIDRKDNNYGRQSNRFIIQKHR